MKRGSAIYCKQLAWPNMLGDHPRVDSRPREQSHDARGAALAIGKR